MNPFINPKKRSISLPDGCKDLIDILQQRDSARDIAIRKFIDLILLQAQQDEASELFIGPTPTSGDTALQYKVGDVWYELSSFPTSIRSDLISELARMAEPGRGLLDLQLNNIRQVWSLALAGPDDGCRLTRVL